MTDRKKRKRTAAPRGKADNAPDRGAEDIWRSDPDLVKRFLQVRRDYEQMCAEVEYILRKRIADKTIETASITSRTKTLNSFLEKLQRKHYRSPFDELTDLAGARVVCLYRNDVARVAEIIRAEFVVVEDIDKLDELGVDQFGYGARHFIVRLGKTASGARYDDLKTLSCEVQVRTVVQDAWAIIQHHMVYKREAQVPTQLQRKLNSLSGLFETVDDQFERIREERESYLAEVRESTDRPKAFLENELNLDSFKEYLKWAFPDRALESWSGQLRLVLDGLLAAEHKTLQDVDRLLKSTTKERELIGKELLERERNLTAQDGTLPSNLEPALALGVSAPNWKKLIAFGPGLERVIQNYRSGTTRGGPET